MFKKSLNVYDTWFGFYIHLKKVTFALPYGLQRRKWVKNLYDVTQKLQLLSLLYSSWLSSMHGSLSLPFHFLILSRLTNKDSP